MKWTAILAVLMVPAFVYGGATMSLSASKASYGPGESIVLTLNVNASEGWNGFDAALAADQAGLKITGRSVLMPAGTFWELGAPVDPANDLNAVKADLGLFNIGTNPWPAGGSDTQTITMSNPFTTDTWINFSFADPGAGIQVAGLVGELTPLTLSGVKVHVTPEPASLLLLALGGLFLRRR